jgi:uncharacterized protein (TIGR03435 family)
MPHRSLRYALCLALAAACVGVAQTGPKLEFEVVSIKPSPEPEPGKGITVGCSGGPETKDPGMFRCQNMDLRNLVTRAYATNYWQITAPDWLRSQRFEISAKVPEGTTKEQLNEMLKSMLVDRFHLAVHHESKEMPKYDLVVAKNGTKLKESVDDPAPNTSDGAPRPPAPGPMKMDKEGYPMLAPGRPGMAMMNGHARLFYPKWTMEQLASQLGGQLGKPVTDATGMTGKYDIALYWASDTMRPQASPAAGAGATPMPAAPEGDNGPTLEKAVQDQLGLRLEAKKGPVDFLVVDHVEKLPTDN